MYYLIDGYNLLFTSKELKKSLQLERVNLIRYLQRQFQKTNCTGAIVFDGSARVEEDGSVEYHCPLEIVYTPKGQNADEFILEKVQFSKGEVTVVSNDRSLQMHCRSEGAKSMSNEAFLKWIIKRSKKKTAKVCEMKIPKAEIEKMVQFFEERMK